MKSYVLTLVSSEGEVTMSSVKNNLREAEDSLFTTSADTELLLAAQNGDGDAFGRLVDPHQRELKTRCRRPCSGPGGALPGSKGEARSALGCTGSRPTPACARSSDGPSGCCRWTTHPRPIRTAHAGAR